MTTKEIALAALTSNNPGRKHQLSQPSTLHPLRAHVPAGRELN